MPGTGQGERCKGAFRWRRSFVDIGFGVLCGGVSAGVTDGSVLYFGQGFSLRGDKDRFVLNADLRRLICDASGKQNVMMVAKDQMWPCLIATGTSYIHQLAEEIKAERAAALARGEKLERSKRQILFGDLMPVNFDNSGRFVLPAELRKRAGITNAVYIHGMMDFFTIWAPEVLEQQEGDEWQGAKDSCAARMAEGGRGRK